MNSIINATLSELKALGKGYVIDSAKAASRLIRKGILVLCEGFPVGLSTEAEVEALELYGIDVKQFNMTFHKSFQTVEDMDPVDYYVQQILHYFSTYGAEMMGIDLPTYIPAEALDLPDGIDLTKLTVIRAVSDDEMVKLVNGWFRRIAAPSPMQTEHARAMLDIATLNLDEIRSFELQILKCDKDGVVPSNPNSFLRYLLFKTTGSTLVIKNRNTRKAIYSANAEMARKIFEKADLESLSSIFLRNKRLFLAFKKLDGCAPYVNKLRRLAEKNHKPLPRECVQNAAAIAAEGDLTAFAAIIEKATNRELVKIFNAIMVKTGTWISQTYADGSVAPQVINVRNGRTFVRSTSKPVSDEVNHFLFKAMNLTEKKFGERLANYRGKYFVIPEYIGYAAPSTEKQFVGAYPFGTRVRFCNGAITVGIHWFNAENNSDGYDYWEETGDGYDYWDNGRVDLDLHLNSATEHFGWNSYFRSGDENHVIYTGDMTDAPRPNGAAEAYYLTPKDDAFVVNVCKYCGPESEDYKLFFTDIAPDTKRRGYTFDPEKVVIPPIPMNIRGGNQNVGLLEDGVFTFYGGSISTGIVPAGNYADFIAGLRASLRGKFMLDDFLINAGATIVDSVADVPAGAEYVDLSPQVLTTQMLMGVVDGEATFAEKKEG